MEQLSMIFRGKSFDGCELPEGYSFEYFTGALGQIDEWLEICREGLIDPGAGPELFRAAILDVSGIDPVKDQSCRQPPELQAPRCSARISDPYGSAPAGCRKQFSSNQR